MSESQNPLQGFLGNLKDKAQDLAENVGKTVESAADKVLGEERVDKIKDVLNTDVGEVAKNVTETVKDKAEDLAENVGKTVESAADKVLGEERVDKIKDATKNLTETVKDKAEDLAENVGKTVESAADKVLGEERVDKIKDVLGTDVKDLLPKKDQE